MASRLTLLLLRMLCATVLANAAACSSRHAQPPQLAPNARETQEKDQRLELDGLVVTPTSAENIAKIHERGMRSLQNGEYAEAVRDFDLCIKADPAGSLAGSALYHAGLALDEQGQFEAALERLVAATERLGPQPLGLTAGLRAVRLACHLERWQLARSLSERLLEQKPRLRPVDDVLIEGALALEAVFRGDDVAAELYVARARNAIESHGLDAPGKIPRDVAAVYFALGEIRRQRATRIGFVPLPPNFVLVLEQRCELILGAQSAYSDAMRAYDAHWSTMAGYRIAELYAELHRDIMAIAPPETIQDKSHRQLFEGAMRLRYSVLVEKALNMMKHTITMAERNQERSEWVTRAQAAKLDLEQRLVAEEAAIDRLPYSRQALEYALHELGKKSAGSK